MLATPVAEAPGYTFAAEESRGDFYSDPDWLGLLCELYGYTPHAITARDGAGRVTGYLPLLQVESPLTGRRLVSLPFSDYSPFLATSAEATDDLIRQAMALAAERRCRSIELRSGANEWLAARADFVANDLYVRWRLPLARDSAQTWARAKKSVQRQIEKARKAGVVVRFGQGPDDMEAYYLLHLRTRAKKHGMPAQSRRYFHRLWETFGGRGAVQVLLAEHAGQVIAGIVVLAAGEVAHYAYGGSDERHLALAPNNLLMWTAIEWAGAQGYQHFDFGRTAKDNPGLMQFKRGWGAVEEPMPYYYYPQVAGLAATNERSAKYQLLTSCWRRLPLAVAGPLGGALYKHLG
jgi:FemAB-related protein (PEP-CTERM system-associated)